MAAVRECVDACDAACDPPRLRQARVLLRQWARRRAPRMEIAGIGEDLDLSWRELTRVVAWIERQQAAPPTGGAARGPVAARLARALELAHGSASSLAEQAHTLEVELVPALSASPRAAGGGTVADRALRTLDEMDSRAARDATAVREALDALIEDLAHR